MWAVRCARILRNYVTVGRYCSHIHCVVCKWPVYLSPANILTTSYTFRLIVQYLPFIFVAFIIRIRIGCLWIGWPLTIPLMYQTFEQYYFFLLQNKITISFRMEWSWRYHMLQAPVNIKRQHLIKDNSTIRPNSISKRRPMGCDKDMIVLSLANEMRACVHRTSE